MTKYDDDDMIMIKTTTTTTTTTVYLFKIVHSDNFPFHVLYNKVFNNSYVLQQRSLNLVTLIFLLVLSLTSSFSSITDGNSLV
jgi:hypothetical protein